MASDQYLKQLNPAYEVVGPSDDTVDVLIGQTNPRAMRIEEINEYVQWFTDAAKRAIDIGFDGVELHAANGALIDQFIQDVSNKREDDYGGSVEKRSRFVLEVVDAVTKAIGAERTSVRFSPFNTTSGKPIFMIARYWTSCLFCSYGYERPLSPVHPHRDRIEEIASRPRVHSSDRTSRPRI